MAEGEQRYTVTASQVRQLVSFLLGQAEDSEGSDQAYLDRFAEIFDGAQARPYVGEGKTTLILEIIPNG